MIEFVQDNVRIYLVRWLPVSTNDAYPTGRGRQGRYLSSAAADYKSCIDEAMEVQDAACYGNKMIFDWYQLKICMFLPHDVLFRKSDDHRKETVDCSNYIKVTEDAVFEYLFPDVVDRKGRKRSADWRVVTVSATLGESSDNDAYVFIELREGEFPGKLEYDNMMSQLLDDTPTIECLF